MGVARTAAAGLVVNGSSLVPVPYLRLLLRYRTRPEPMASPISHPTKSMAKMDEDTLALPTTVSLPVQWWACTCSIQSHIAFLVSRCMRQLLGGTAM